MSGYAGTDMVIEALGVQPVVRRLGRVKEHVENWAPVWPEVFEHMERSTARQFASEGMYGSDGWAALAPLTLADKRLGGFPPTILERTGDMKDSFLVDDHPDHIAIAMRDEAWWGSSNDYAGYHQDGTDLMPQRMIIQPPEGSRRYMVRILQRYALANSPTVGVTA